jgi:hypothetical protein
LPKTGGWHRRGSIDGLVSHWLYGKSEEAATKDSGALLDVDCSCAESINCEMNKKENPDGSIRGVRVVGLYGSTSSRIPSGFDHVSVYMSLVTYSLSQDEEDFPSP